MRSGSAPKMTWKTETLARQPSRHSGHNRLTDEWAIQNPKSQIQNETACLSYKNCSEVNSAGSES